MATYARRHGGDGVDRPPHGNSSRILANCEYCKKNDLLKDLRLTPIHYFDLQSWLGTPDWDGIRAGINEDCARRYQDRKNELKRHFDNYGGYDNVENAKNHPPDTQTQEAWEKIINELFLNADFMKRSVKNESNRSKQLYAIADGNARYRNFKHAEGLEEDAHEERRWMGE
ncbi:hypothetical protein R6Q57_019816 [Mikania cordata]